MEKYRSIRGRKYGAESAQDESHISLLGMEYRFGNIFEGKLFLSVEDRNATTWLNFWASLRRFLHGFLPHEK